MTTNTISAIIDATLENGGGTFDRNTLEPVTHGLAVSIRPDSFAIVSRYSDNFETRIRNAIDALRLAYPRAHVGTWFDTETKFYHIDPVTVVATEKYARRLAIRNNQIAYFNLDTLTEVRI